MKKIVISCDGTWNKPTQTDDGQPAPTNVFLLHQHLAAEDDQGIRQLAFYEAGVGSDGNFLQRAIEGYSGAGTTEKIKNAYRFLVRHYEPGDAIHLFGFSRGAFAVRSLAGFIRKCGVLRADRLALIDEAYDYYREGGDDTRPDAPRSVRFRADNAVEPQTSIRMIGVWDTVGALGNPLLPNFLISARSRFHDTTLSRTVQHAFHALAIDEKRGLFRPTLWQQSLDAQGRPANPDQVLEQAWFVGVHADVGGGYARAGLAHVALEWMLEKAASVGLACHPLAASCSPDAAQPCHETWDGAYRIIQPLPFHRPIAAHVKGVLSRENLHASVLSRVEGDPGYRPPELMKYLKAQGQGETGGVVVR